jgi:hypothetical protein
MAGGLENRPGQERSAPLPGRAPAPKMVRGWRRSGITSRRTVGRKFSVSFLMRFTAGEETFSYRFDKEVGAGIG